jgi:hypothetical protein
MYAEREHRPSLAAIAQNSVALTFKTIRYIPSLSKASDDPDPPPTYIRYIGPASTRRHF